MEKILAQQAELLQKLETLSKQDRVMQIAQTAELLDVDKDGDKQVEELQGIKESLDKGNDLLIKQLTNLQKMAKGLKDIDFNRIADLAQKDVPLSIGDKLKQSLAALNPLKAMDAVTSKFKNLFSTEKGRYINEQARELRRQDPSMSVSDSKEKATKDYVEARDAKLAQRQIDYAIDNDKEIPINNISDKFKNPLTTKKDDDEEENDAVFSNEEEREGSRVEEEKIRLLTQIEENTRGDGQSTGKVPGGMFSGILGKAKNIFKGIGKSFLGSLAAAFSYKVILAAVKKIPIIAGILSIGNGIKEAFLEWKDSGDIGKALFAGLAGITEVLTFGLVGEEELKKMGSLIYDNVIAPIVNFIRGVRDALINMLPDWAAKLIGIDKVNPDTAAEATPASTTPMIETAPSSSGTIVTRVSNENEEARLAAPSNQSSNIVNAPTTNISGTTNNNLIKPIVRNSDNSYNNLVKSKYSYI